MADYSGCTITLKKEKENPKPTANILVYCSDGPNYLTRF